MARRTSGRKGKSSQTKRGNGGTDTAGRAPRRGGRAKRSLLSRLKFW